MKHAKQQTYKFHHWETRSIRKQMSPTKLLGDNLQKAAILNC